MSLASRPRSRQSFRWPGLLLVANLAILGVAPAAGAQAVADPRAHVQFYIETFGSSDPREAPVARAEQIFDRLRQVAGRPGKYQPRLQVVDSPGDPWAIALPDGYVVLSRPVLDLVYRDATEAEGDARLAFVLGHELAHLIKNDFWHQEVFQALVGESSPPAIGLRELLHAGADVPGSETERRLNAIRLKEIQADDAGFLYAGLAGFAVDTLFGPSAAGQPDFFQHWMTQTQTRLDRQHPAPEARAQLLRARLRRLVEKLEFFHYGVRLAHFGRYEDAEYFLREFQQVFPGREVLGNLGYVYLQRARRELPPTRAYRYCLSTVLDPHTRAVALRPRGVESGVDDPLPPGAQEGLNEAVHYLKQAVEADGAYLPARLNLAMAYFYLGEIYEARAMIEKARQLAPDDGEVQNLRALILYQEGVTSDLWPTALKLLEELAARPDAPACATYNLAQILEERGREGKARAVWATLILQLAALPPPYRATVCRRVADAGACRTDVATQQGKPLPWPLPVPLGLDLLAHRDGANPPLAGWARFAFDWQKPGMRGYIYVGPDGASVLELDGFVEMVVLRSVHRDTAAVVACCGMPSWKRALAHGELWAYGLHWALLVRDEQISEVWTIR